MSEWVWVLITLPPPASEHRWICGRSYFLRVCVQTTRETCAPVYHPSRVSVIESVCTEYVQYVATMVPLSFSGSISRSISQSEFVDIDWLFYRHWFVCVLACLLEITITSGTSADWNAAGWRHRHGATAFQHLWVLYAISATKSILIDNIPAQKYTFEFRMWCGLLSSANADEWNYYMLHALCNAQTFCTNITYIRDAGCTQQ